MFAVSKQTYCTNLLCRSGTNLEIWRSTFQQNMKTSAFLRRCWFFFFYNKCFLFRHVTVTVLLNDIEVAKQSPDNHSPVQSLSPRLRAFWAAAPRQHGPTLLHYSRTQRHFLSHTIQLHHDDSHFFCFHCSYNRLLPRLLSLLVLREINSPENYLFNAFSLKNKLIKTADFCYFFLRNRNVLIFQKWHVFCLMKFEFDKSSVAAAHWWLSHKNLLDMLFCFFISSGIAEPISIKKTRFVFVCVFHHQRSHDKVSWLSDQEFTTISYIMTNTGYKSLSAA